MFAHCLNQGWIEAIVGSMFSGKSEELIRRVIRAKYAKQGILVFKHSWDDRYGDNENIVSHMGNNLDAIPVADLKEMKKIINKSSNIKVVAIDEAQFFEEGIVDLIEELANQGKRVIVAGLDQDFKGEPFKIMMEILARAEKIDKLNAICNICGAPASKTQRIINGRPARYSDPVILVGASECYEPRCRKCHEILK